MSIHDNTYKLIVAGSRGWTDYDILVHEVRHHLAKFALNRTVQIVSGTAKGADKLGEQMATFYGIPLIQFPAQWTTIGRAAGFIRNTEMAKYANGAIVFWDKQSRGAHHMLNEARKQRINATCVWSDGQVFNYEPLKV